MQKKQLTKIILAALIFVIALYVPALAEYKDYMLIAAFLVVGLEIVLAAVKNVIRGKVFDESFLMSLATIGAFYLTEYAEAVGVMLFYQIGEYFQARAVDNSRKAITELLDLQAEFANLNTPEGLLQVAPEELAIGQIITIKPGEKVPIDGEVISGYSYLNTAALTGESLPAEVTVGSEILSGCINLQGVLEVRVLKEYDDSTVAKILELVENASNNKAETEKFISKFAKYYTPVVVVIALLLASIPPLFFSGALFQDWLYRALTFLVISCPCALVLSIPLSFFGGIGAASKAGILVKGSNYIETLSKIKNIVFDKTGTLTEGKFSVLSVNSANCSQEKLLELVAHAEVYSNHPIAKSIQEAYGKKIDTKRVDKLEDLPGFGIVAEVDGKKILLGNELLMAKNSITIPQIEGSAKSEVTELFVAIEGVYAGYLEITDKIKKDAEKTIALLKKMSIDTNIFTGDTNKVAEAVARKLAINKVYSKLLPQNKLEKLEELLQQQKIGKTMFVGDGVNDAPVLARADIGVAMGAMGSDAAIQAADLVIMDDSLEKIVVAINIAKQTMQVVKINIVFVLTVKFMVLVLGFFGLASIWLAIFADVGVSVLAILNSMRLLIRK